ncbi:MAG: hypothetical protein S4CHLAM7_15170 [Chlamydiae bacterium]|nr:hypothetical protein [Chlamydiota bacterium]
MAIGFLFLLTLLSATFSASETAHFSLSPMKIREYQNDPDPKKRRIANLLKSPLELLVTILMINVLVNILIQDTTSHIFGTQSSWLLTVGVPLVITLVFGEIIPKTLALANNARFAYFISPLIAGARYVLGPIRKALTIFTSLMTKSVFFFLKKEKNITKEELKHALKTGTEKGILNSREASLMQGYIYLSHKPVKDFKRPREEIIYYNIKDPLTALEHILVDQEVSRLPVVEGDLENILGIISVRNYFLQKEKLSSPEDLTPFLSKSYYVPESMPAKNLLRYLDNKGKSIAMVVDEYGSVSGIITQEDLIEAVIGEISDRRDIHSNYTSAGKDTIIATGKLELTEFEEIFGTHLISPSNMVTINGWLIEKIGTLPKTGDKLTEDGFFFHILSADPNRIRRVYIRKVKKVKKV